MVDQSDSEQPNEHRQQHETAEALSETTGQGLSTARSIGIENTMLVAIGDELSSDIAIEFNQWILHFHQDSHMAVTSL